MYDVVALGELLIDFTTQSIDSDGYPTMAAHPGGAPANFLAAIAKFGGKVGMLGKVGTDTFGKLLTNTLRGAGIETKGLVAADDVFTTLAFVTLDENGDREFAFARKPGADTQLTFDELDLSLIDETRVFHFGTLSLTDEPARTTTYRAVEYAKTHGKLVTYDPNLRKPLWRSLDEAKEQMLWGLRQADVVKISDEAGGSAVHSGSLPGEARVRDVRRGRLLVPEPERRRPCGQPEEYQSCRYDRRGRYFRRQRRVEAFADRQGTGRFGRSRAARDRLVRVQSCGPFYNEAWRHFECARFYILDHNSYRS